MLEASISRIDLLKAFGGLVEPNYVEHDRLTIAQLHPDNRVTLRPLFRLYGLDNSRFKPKDIAIGVPSMWVGGKKFPEIMCRFGLTTKIPAVDEEIFTYTFSDHTYSPESRESSRKLDCRPRFVQGRMVGRSFDARKANEPWCITNMEVLPGTSGSPCFNEVGRIWGVCSKSFRGSESDSRVFPIVDALDIQIHENQDGSGIPKTLRQLGKEGYTDIEF